MEEGRRRHRAQNAKCRTDNVDERSTEGGGEREKRNTKEEV
jgi:hypothetical protein